MAHLHVKKKKYKKGVYSHSCESTEIPLFNPVTKPENLVAILPTELSLMLR